MKTEYLSSIFVVFSFLGTEATAGAADTVAATRHLIPPPAVTPAKPLGGVGASLRSPCDALTDLPADRPGPPASDDAKARERQAECEDHKKAATRLGTSAVGAGGAGGGLGWQSAVVNGLATFIATRAEEELSLWVAQNFRQRLCAAGPSATSEKAGDEEAAPEDPREPWFPKVCDLVEGDDAGQVPGSVFISALRDDIEQLPYALLRELLIRSGFGPDGVRHLTDSARALGGAVAAMRSGKAPRDAIAGLARVTELSSQCAVVDDIDRTALLGCSLAIMGVLSREIQGRCTAGRCTTDVGLLLQDPVILAALNQLNVGRWLDDAQKRAIIDAVLVFIEWVELHPLPRSAGSEERLEYARALTREVLSLARTVVKTAYRDRTTPEADAVLATLEAVDAMVRREYADGIRAAVTVIDAILGAIGTQHPEVTTALRELRRYVVLAADLAAAKDSEAVRAAISTAAAPAGGWRLKRERLTLSLTALAGLSLSGEYIKAQSNYGLAVAPMAAVGLDLSGPVGRRGSTFGAFASILDLGQLVSARVVNRAKQSGEIGAATASEAEFLSVLSPGAYLKFGIRRTPLVFGGGVAYAPAMRKVYYTASDAPGGVKGDPFSVLRFGVFMAVDITIFPLSRGKRLR